MNKIQLLKEPGYIYDLNFIFCLKFNTQLYIDALPDNSNKEEGIKYFNEILNKFKDIPDDLYVFFHAIDSGRTFLSTYYFAPYRNEFSKSYNFKFLQKELSDFEKLLRNVIRFYFYDLDESDIEECASSLKKVCACIKDSKYSDEEKIRLYEFFLDPISYMQTLQRELMAKDFVLSEYYKENYEKIIGVYNKTTFEILSNQLKAHNDINIDDANMEVAYVSYCLLNKFCISVCLLENSFIPLLGYEYFSVIGCAEDDNSPSLDLCALGTALCEDSRVKIFNFLLERGEVICKDLEKEFNFSGSTAYHHINIMARSGLVKTRNEGKTIFYSINTKYISSVIDVFNNILKVRGRNYAKNME